MPATTTNSTDASRPLSAARYASLLRDVQRLAKATDAELSQQKVIAFWNLGDRIQRERIAEHSGYHNSVLRDLARATHLSVRNLQYAVAFHRGYRRCPKDTLTWAHYRVLLDRPNADSRAHYRKLALDEQLSVRQLVHLIQQDQRSATATNTTPVPRPTLPSYLYAATVTNIIDGDTLDLRIDLGFHTERLGRFRLADIDCPELVGAIHDSPSSDSAGRLARDFVYSRVMSAKTIVVKTQRTDLHGRYVAHLFYSATELSVDACFVEGTHLNNELVVEGHADTMLT